MLKSIHFTTEQELLDWANLNVRCGDIISINHKYKPSNISVEEYMKNRTEPNEDWILFYCD